MTADPSARAAEITEQARAHRPRWRSAARTPAWFSGRELDLLSSDERDKLYKELRSCQQAARWFPLVIALANVSNAIHGFQSPSTRPLWIAMASGFVAVAIGAWLYRRQGILQAARRHVRESADWPLRVAQRNA